MSGAAVYRQEGDTVPSDIASRLLDYIRQYIAFHGYSPSIREMCKGANISSTSVANYWMRKLRDLGMITWVDAQARTVRFVGNVVPTDASSSDLVLKLTAEQRQLIEEACGGGGLANCAKATLILMATQQRMADTPRPRVPLGVSDPVPSTKVLCH